MPHLRGSQEKGFLPGTRDEFPVAESAASLGWCCVSPARVPWAPSVLLCPPGFWEALRMGHMWTCFANGTVLLTLLLSTPPNVMAVPREYCRRSAAPLLPPHTSSARRASVCRGWYHMMADVGYVRNTIE